MTVLGSTAEVCAAFRELAGVDPHARHFLRGPKVTTLARTRPLHPLLRALSRRLVGGAYDYENVRTRHLDALVARELEAGAEQLVILGAGFDSRAHRFAVRTFEVDLPMLQARKRRLAQALAAAPTYVEADLERDDVVTRLGGAGFDPRARTLVLWIGVSMYVSAAAVARTLDLVSELGPGSLVAFDYVFRRPEEDFIRAVGRRGEPMRFSNPAAETLAVRHGLELELDRRGLPYGFIAIAHARVP
jgi:methyltransferase (TIGR00027 family)